MADIPRQVGRYQIEAMLGGGGMGVVYRAHDPVIDRRVAIKLIRARLLADASREEFLARFQNEARLAGRCEHPGIVRIYDCAMHEGDPYLVMEYVEGADLGQVFRRGTQASITDTCQVAVAVLDALAYAHGFGIIHRDIKPANILIAAGGSVKILDFGISRIVVPDIQQSASLVGTPSYMAPEQCRGEAVDGRSDVFAVGCVMFELLTGERAFAGTNPYEIGNRIINQRHPSLPALRADLPAALVDIIDRALAKRREHRFAGAAEMAAALRTLSATALPSVEELATVVRPPPRVQLSRSRIDPNDPSLTTIERRLAYHIGPIAGYALHGALQSAQSAEELCALLGEKVPGGQQRTVFMREVMGVLNASGTLWSTQRDGDSCSTGQDTARLAVLTRALTEVMGPIASRLIERARKQAGSVEQTEALCADLISNKDARERFRRLLAGSALGDRSVVSRHLSPESSERQRPAPP